MMRKIILMVTLTVVETKNKIQEGQEIIRICKNYIVALSMELSRKELPKVIPKLQRIQDLLLYLEW